MWRQILQFDDRVNLKFFDRVNFKLFHCVKLKIFNRVLPYDPEAKVAKAITLLKSKNVAENIDALLNKYYANSGGIDINRDGPCPVELITALGAKEIAKSISYTFNKKLIQLLVADLRESYISDDSTNYGSLFVLFNGECVLCSDVRVYVKDYKRYGVYFSASSLISLKAGIWIDELAYLVKALTDFERGARDKQRAQKISRAASNIDFGDDKRQS